MQSLAPTGPLGRRSRDLLAVAAVVFLAGALLLVAGIALHIFNLVLAFNPGWQIYDLTRKGMLALGAGIIVASFALALRAITWRTDNARAREVSSLLAEHLDQRFIFIRNVSKRPLGALDAVLVSQHGILVFRISRRRGIFCNIQGDWLWRRAKGGWKPMRWNPTREAALQVDKLRAYLEDYQLTALPIRAVIVFTRDSPLVQLTLREPAAPVVSGSQLLEHLHASYLDRERMDGETARQVAHLLYR